MQIKSLTSLLEGRLKNDENLHRIAISNLNDQERQLARWWVHKYRLPEKPFHEYTLEELYLEYLEDYYEKHPEEMERFMAGYSAPTGRDDWDGKHDPQTEREVRQKLQRIGATQVDVNKYQTEGDENLSKDQVDQIIAGLGRRLPGSREVRSSDPNEFNEDFLGV